MVTERRIGFLPPDLTLVQSEMMKLGVLGYSRTQHVEWYADGILFVSGNCHLGEIIRITIYKYWFTNELYKMPTTTHHHHYAGRLTIAGVPIWNKVSGRFSQIRFLKLASAFPENTVTS